MSKKTTEFIGYLIASPFIIAISYIILIYFTFSGGFVTFKFYQWFILPHFPQFPLFTWIHFAGFRMFISSFKLTTLKKNIKKEYLDETKEGIRIIVSILFPWLTLFIGYLIYLFIY